jgi:hypothetical protein
MFMYSTKNEMSENNIMHFIVTLFMFILLPFHRGEEEIKCQNF